MTEANQSYDRDRVIADINDLAKSGKRVVFVSGNFNIVHPGHLRLFRYARDCGDVLVVGVNEDRLNKESILNEDLRLEAVKYINWIDYAFVMREPAGDFIESLQPAFVVKGKEHEKLFNPENEAVGKYGGKLLFSSGDITFSSLDLIRDEIQSLNLSSINKPQDFPVRHGFSIESLMNTIDKFKTLKVLVIGDTIVDEYITCDPIGMSQEDATLVVSPIMNRKFIGGAAIVASHAAGLGAGVTFLTVVGDDENAGFVDENLKNYNVEAKLFTDSSRPTSLKQRFRANEKSLLRVSQLRQDDISAEIGANILAEIKSRIQGLDLLIFSDFNYGCLPDWLVVEISELCKSQGVMMAADSQSSSQIGDLSRFKDMSLVTPTERELRLAIRDFTSGLVVAAETLRTVSNAKHVVVTLGREGSLIHVGSESDVSDVSEQEWQTDRLPAMNSAAKDVAGAGDSLLTAAALSLAVGADIWQSCFLGSIAAACQVSRIGNTPLSSEDIKKELMI